MGFPPYLVRQHSYRQLQLAGIDEVPDPAKLDIELNAIVAAYNALAKRERAYTTPSGSLTQVPTAASLSLSSSTRFVATAGQTSFVVPTYDTGTDTVEVWYGAAGSGMVMLDPNNVAKTDTTHVTVPAQSLGAIVVILVFSTGAGVLATLAVDGMSGGTSGATLIGFYGSGLFVSHTVEAALVEFKTTYNAFISAIGSVGNVLRADGSVPLAADLDAAGHHITGLAAATLAGQAVEYSQFASFASVWNSLQAYYAKLDGTTPWTGDWNAGNHKLTGLAAGTAASDAVCFSQLSIPLNATALQSGKNYLVNGSMQVYQDTIGTVTTTSGQWMNGCDVYRTNLNGTTVTGSITQGTVGAPGGFGFSLKWSAVTLTGAGTIKVRAFVESTHARAFIARAPFLAFNIKHTCLAAISCDVNYYTAATLDRFNAPVLVATQNLPNIAASSDSRQSSTAGVVMGANAANGIMVELVFNTGACAGIQLEVADVQLETGTWTTMEYESYSVALFRVHRYFYRFLSVSITTGPPGWGRTADTAYIPWVFPALMRTTPTIGGAGLSTLINLVSQTTISGLTGFQQVIGAGTGNPATLFLYSVATKVGAFVAGTPYAAYLAPGEYITADARINEL